jgi:outer membrane receptor for ferrienterochelin and colicins
MMRAPAASAAIPLRCAALLLTAGACLPCAGQTGESASRALFDEFPEIDAAALHTHTLDNAPASVSVITAAEIRRYGYRTLADALAAARGFYPAYDNIYHYIGVRGLGQPGDYNTRFLVMLNGHPLTDTVYDSNNFFGQDLGIDLDLVSRIEIIRGPTSALYGSNGILATINIVTVSPGDFDRFRVSTETGSFSEKKAFVASSAYLGGGASLLLAASVFSNRGQNLRFADAGDRALDGLDGERGYHSFANLVWRNWTVTAYFNSREKQVPVPWGDEALPFHRGDFTRDGRNFVRAGWSRPIGGLARLRWEGSYDQYCYDDRFDYERDSGLEDVRSLARGDWLGTKATLSLRVQPLGELTFGAQVSADVRNLQQDRTVYPIETVRPAISHRNRWEALFAEQEIEMGGGWTAHAGLRFDHTRYFGRFVSPRLAVLYQPSSRTTYKFVFGRPFRNPSVFERFYTDGGASFLPNPSLRSELALSWEASAERKLGRAFSVTLNAYHYRLDRMIATAFLENDVEQYRNTGYLRSTGVEMEAGGRLRRWLEAAGSLAMQRSERGKGTEALANSPRCLSKLRLATPLRRESLWLSSVVQYMSPRLTRTAERLRAVLLADLTVSTNALHAGFEVQFGVRNLANWRYSDPTALALDALPQAGRTAFVKVIWSDRE